MLLLLSWWMKGDMWTKNMIKWRIIEERTHNTTVVEAMVVVADHKTEADVETIAEKKKSKHSKEG